MAKGHKSEQPGRSKPRRPDNKAAPLAYVGIGGIGGIGGSLHAFQAFVAGVSPGSRLAYILIPHLAPD